MDKNIFFYNREVLIKKQYDEPYKVGDSTLLLCFDIKFKATENEFIYIKGLIDNLLNNFEEQRLDKVSPFTVINPTIQNISYLIFSCINKTAQENNTTIVNFNVKSNNINFCMEDIITHSIKFDDIYTYDNILDIQYKSYKTEIYNDFIKRLNEANNFFTNKKNKSRSWMKTIVILSIGVAILLFVLIMNNI